MKRIGLGLALAIAGVATSAAADGGLGNFDFGLWKELETRLTSFQLFGVLAPVKESSLASIDAATAEANPTALVTVAKGLRAKVVSAKAELGPNIDMMVPWPNAAQPTHLIACNEEGAAQPGLQRIRLSDGAVETILTGTISCDPVRATPWGTVIAGEENGTTGCAARDREPARRRRAWPSTASPARRRAVSVPRTSWCGPRSAGSRSKASRSTRAASCTTATRTGPERARPAARTSSSCRPIRGPAARRSRISPSRRSRTARSTASASASARAAPTTVRAATPGSAPGSP